MKGKCGAEKKRADYYYPEKAKISNQEIEHPWEDFYELLLGQLNISSSDYWQMTPAEVGWILEAHRPKVINGIHEDDFDNMLQRRRELEKQGIKVL